ncbi:hypothetical protein BI036_gp122 [Morganella phage vB_MmoM_MP1]|uniref:Uncharacterized protein n=1 Tax=Morganella phage vB_MmoM_MP1 TaxID=1852628 RepID=A0A192YAA4_9CAUD|nr:hypothetical protein BI036_gp122 [Morganella phage vB_MmoM_MP1]ANM46644.1 hypothetical protein MP1_gp0121 [Morganella phage vB_MmoM_MP1]
MFHLFMFDMHYPSGGFNDYVGTYPTESECYAAIKEANKTEYPYDNYQIVSGTEIIMWGRCVEV